MKTFQIAIKWTFANIAQNCTAIIKAWVNRGKGWCSRSHPTVPLQGFHQGVVGLSVKAKALVHLLEVQVFKGGRGLRALLSRGAAFVRGPLQVVFVMHPHGARQHVVHHHHADGDAAALDAVKAVKFRQQRPRVLVQVLEWETKTTSTTRGWETLAFLRSTAFCLCFSWESHHVVTRKQFLEELGLFVLHRLDDELVVAGEIEPGAAGSGVGQLDQRLVTDGELKVTRQQRQLKFWSFCSECATVWSPLWPDSRQVWCQTALWSSETPAARKSSGGSLGSDEPASGCSPHWGPEQNKMCLWHLCKNVLTAAWIRAGRTSGENIHFKN